MASAQSAISSLDASVSVPAVRANLRSAATRSSPSLELRILCAPALCARSGVNTLKSPDGHDLTDRMLAQPFVVGQISAFPRGVPAARKA